jgi:hypothetical protein
LKQWAEWALSDPAVEGIEHELVGTKSELAVTPGFFVECTRNALLEFTIWIVHVSTVETQVVQVNHQFKIFRDV